MTRLLIPAALLAVAWPRAAAARRPRRPLGRRHLDGRRHAGSLARLDKLAAVPAQRAGAYRLRYPPGWRISENSGSGGPVLSLLPPRGPGVASVPTSPPPDPAAERGIAASRSRWGRWKAAAARPGLDGGHHHAAGRGALVRAHRCARDPPEGPAGAYDRVLASFRLR